jgi:hypothetical protein
MRPPEIAGPGLRLGPATPPGAPDALLPRKRSAVKVAQGQGG